MKFNFENLDNQTRELMSNEIKADVSAGRLYPSKRFNDKGVHLYPDLLQQSVIKGDEETLASALRANNCFKAEEERQTKKGVIMAKVPDNASQLVAEGEFNRFYIRALCLRATSNKQQLEIYRARHSDNPRVESEMLIGQSVDPEALLADLRKNVGVDTALGLPPGPNSGLSVKLV
jgi:hypothetical protein